jgi:hypothetical protein
MLCVSSVLGYAFATTRVLHVLYSARTRRRARESQPAARFQTSALLLVLVQGWQTQRGAVHRESYATTVTRGQSPPQSTKRTRIQIYDSVKMACGALQARQR